MTQSKRTVSITEVAPQLEEFIAGMSHNEEICLTVDDKTVAVIVRMRTDSWQPRGFGSCKGMVTIIRDDEEHLADFKDYM